MAIELEYKLQLPSPQVLEDLLSSPLITPLLEGPFRELPMKTTYYDGEDRSFSRLHWTLRHRMEGEESVVCLKTPVPFSHSRNEWQVSAPSLNRESVEALIRQGAPRELLDYYEDSPPKALCGAHFLRRCAMLTFPDGSRAEIAADRGEVFGPRGVLPILELELELYSGEPGEMTRLARELCRTYSLEEQPRSKFARAKTLV